MLTKKKSEIHIYIKNFYLVLLALVILFGRSFTGLYIFNYRIGEYLILLCLLISIFILFLPYDRLPVKFDKLNFYILKAIVFHFFLTVLLTSGSFLNTYTFKSSSYIWTFSFLYIGLFIMKDLNDNWFVRMVPFFLQLLYIFF